MPNGSTPEPDSETAFYAAIGGTLFFAVLAFGLAVPLKVSLSDHISLNVNDALIGVIATLPMVAFLYWFTRTEVPSFAEFRSAQIEMFSKIGFEFTWPRIIMMSIAAGVCEELFFRGLIQTGIAQYSNAMLGLAIGSVVFGILHWRTRLYAIIATMIGVWLGLIYLYTENILPAMIAHGLYDVVALYYTRVAIHALSLIHI